MGTLKAIVDKSEDIPEGFGDFYIARDDGKFHLQVDDLDESGKSLMAALGKERAKAIEGERRVKATEDRLKTLEKERQNLGTKVKEVSSRENQFQSQIDDLQTQLNSQSQRFSTTLERHMIDGEAMRAISAKKGNIALLLPVIKQQTRVRQAESGDFITEVLDKDKNPRIGNSKGDNMTIDQLVEELHKNDEYAAGFYGSGARGSGARSTDTRSKVGPPKQTLRILATDQNAINANIDQIASGDAIIVDE